jgi:hypothetical protein
MGSEDMRRPLSTKIAAPTIRRMDEAAIARVEDVNPASNAAVLEMHDQARTAARAAAKVHCPEPPVRTQ